MVDMGDPGSGRRGAQVVARVVTELAVIVAGVLIALAVQSWYNARVDRRTEQEYLQRLAQDLARDSVTLALLIERRQISEAVYLDVVTKLQAADSSIGPLIATLVGPASLPGYNSTTFEELTSSGGWRIIADQNVRSSTMEYYASVNRYRERLSFIRDMGYDEMQNLAWETGVFPDAIDSPRPLTAEEMASLRSYPRRDAVLRRARTYHVMTRRILEEWQETLFGSLAIVRGALR
jgi:hypothetical protein